MKFRETRTSPETRFKPRSQYTNTPILDVLKNTFQITIPKLDGEIFSILDKLKTIYHFPKSDIRSFAYQAGKNNYTTADFNQTYTDFVDCYLNGDPPNDPPAWFTWRLKHNHKERILSK